MFVRIYLIKYNCYKFISRTNFFNVFDSLAFSKPFSLLHQNLAEKTEFCVRIQKQKTHFNDLSQIYELFIEMIKTKQEKVYVFTITFPCYNTTAVSDCHKVVFK